MADCPSPDTGMFHGYCARCGTWGHRASACRMHHVHVTMDEYTQYERAEAGYPYHPQSDYYTAMLLLLKLRMMTHVEI